MATSFHDPLMSDAVHRAKNKEIRVMQVGLSIRSESKKGPFLVLVYKTIRNNSGSGSGRAAVFRCRHIPITIDVKSGDALLSFKKDWLEQTVRRLEVHPRHASLINQIPKSQLERLLVQMYDLVMSSSKSQSFSDITKANILPDAVDRTNIQLPKFSEPEDADIISEFANEDLNRLDDEQLAERKARMDIIFNKNRITPDSPDFVYDLRMDFDQTPGAVEEKVAIWDEDDD